MTDEQKREYAEAIKHALGMGYGPPMDGEEGWVPPRDAKPITVTHHVDCSEVDQEELAKAFRRVMARHGDTLRNLHRPMTVEDADDEDAWDVLYGDVERTAKERAENAQAVIEAIREAKERRMAEELAKQRAKAAEPKPAPPSNDPWAVIGKAEDDGEWIMKKVRDFG